jgi:hypothetical protein
MLNLIEKSGVESLRIQVKTTNGNMTLKSLCNIYLQHQQAKAASAEITIRHHADQISCLKKFMSFIGQHRKINEILEPIYTFR